MKGKKIDTKEILKAISENKAGRPVKAIAAELNIDTSTFYYWRKKYDLFAN